MEENNLKEEKVSETLKASPKEQPTTATLPAQCKHWATAHRSFLSVVGLAVIFFILLCSAFALGRHSSNRLERRNQFSNVIVQRGYNGESGGMMGSGFGMRNGLRATNNSDSNRVEGVVTAVNGDTLTVAGNGKTTQVTVSSNTTFAGASQPAQVNDTIVAIGARDSSDNLVASAVNLIRQ